MGNWIQGASGIWTQKVWDSRPNRLEPETLAYLTSNPNASRDWWNIDQNIKQIKYASGVVLNSVTANLSIVDGKAFVTNPSVDLRPYIGMKLSISDGSKSLVGFGKAAGTGETLGDEILSDPTFDNASAWTVIQSGWSLSGGKGVKVSDATGRYMYETKPLTVGGLYKGHVTIDAISGSMSLVFLGYSTFSTYKSVPGLIEGYTTKTGPTLTNVGVNAGAASQTATIDDISAKQVLTPSSTGITIVSTKGGTTYNWASNGGINANAASYTITITKE